MDTPSINSLLDSDHGIRHCLSADAHGAFGLINKNYCSGYKVSAAVNKGDTTLNVGMDKFKCPEIAIEWIISKAKPFIRETTDSLKKDNKQPAMGYSLSIDRPFGSPVINLVSMAWFDALTATQWLKVEIEPIADDNDALTAELEAITPTSTRSPKELGEPSVIWKKLQKIG